MSIFPLTGTLLMHPTTGQMKKHLWHTQIILPFLCSKKRISLGLSSDQYVLVLFDVFKGQCTSKELKKLEDNNILYMQYVQCNCAKQLHQQTALQKTFCRAISTVVWNWDLAAIRQRHDRGGGNADECDETIGCTVGGGTTFILAACPANACNC